MRVKEESFLSGHGRRWGQRSNPRSSLDFFALFFAESTARVAWDNGSYILSSPGTICAHNVCTSPFRTPFALNWRDYGALMRGARKFGVSCWIILLASARPRGRSSRGIYDRVSYRKAWHNQESPRSFYEAIIYLSWNIKQIIK